MLALQLAQRFRKTRSQQRFVSFISMSSTVGIGLGCFVLITLLSVMNGFERELTTRILTVVPHGEIYSVDNKGIENLDAQLYRFQQDKRIAQAVPFTGLTGMLQFKGALKAIQITGLPIDDVSGDFVDKVEPSQWTQFAASDNGVIVGKGIALEMGLSVGDRVQILVPQTTSDLTFKAPNTISLEVSGVLSIGGELDNQLGIMHLQKASQALELATKAKGIRFSFHDPFGAAEAMRDIGYSFPQAVYMSDWTRTQGHLYNDIQLVRTVVYIALVLVISVACFNIVSSLVMAVRDKQAAIAILKTMGATDNTIRMTFVFQGIINGLVGVISGVGLAVIIAPNLSDIVGFVEQALSIEILSGDIYFIDFLPSELQWLDVIATVCVALFLSVTATLYPAHKAAKISPSAALH